MTAIPVRTDVGLTVSPQVAVCLAVFVVGCIFPWRDGIVAEGYFANHRIMQIGLLCAVSLTWVSESCRHNPNLEHSMLLGILLCYGGGLLSAILAPFVSHALLDYLLWVLLGVLFASCVPLGKSPWLPILGIVFLVCHAFLVFLAMLYVGIALSVGDPLTAGVIYPATENIRFFNQVQVFIFPLWLLLIGHPRWGRLAWLMFFANVLLYCLGGARGAGLVLLLMLAAIGFCWPHWRRQVLHALLASVAAVLVYGVLNWLQIDGLYDLTRSGSSHRISIWAEILRGLHWHHMVWGEGPAHYVVFSQQFIFGHPHNSILQWILEWGGVSFLGVSLFVLGVVRRAFGYVKQQPDDRLTQVVLASWLSALAYSLVDGVIVMPIAQTLFVVFAGLLWGRVFLPLTQINNTSSQGQFFLLRTVLVSLLVLVITTPFIFFASQYYMQQQQESLLEIKGPRFWINGMHLRVSGCFADGR